MGQRSSTVTVVRLVQAFLEQRTWTQKALADRLELTTPAVREKLRELEAVFNLEREEDHPHVYWSVPRDWFPGGILFTRDQMPELLRLLMRLPQGKVRDGLLNTVLRNLPKGDARASDSGLVPSAVVPPTETKQEEQYLAVVEDAAARKVALGCHYFTASRGQMSSRHVSVHRVMLGRAARFVGTCHRDGTLKWFRVENIVSAHLDSSVPFRASEPEAVEQFLRASVDGFNAGGVAAELSFVVRDPESRWVQNNLLPSMKVDGLSSNRIRVTIETNAILQVARYVVGLGAAARAETPALADAVEVLARGALGERASLTTNR